MSRVAMLVLFLAGASCGSINQVSGDGGAGGAGGASGAGGAPGTGGSSGGGGAPGDAGRTDAGGGGALTFRGGISTLGPAAAPAGGDRLRVIRNGIRVPAAPVCNGSLCFSGGITQ